MQETKIKRYDVYGDSFAGLTDTSVDEDADGEWCKADEVLPVIDNLQKRIGELEEMIHQPANVERLRTMFDQLSQDDRFELARYALTKIRN